MQCLITLLLEQVDVELALHQRSTKRVRNGADKGVVQVVDATVNGIEGAGWHLPFDHELVLLIQVANEGIAADQAKPGDRTGRIDHVGDVMKIGSTPGSKRSAIRLD